jgi:hypothetical protein
MENKTKNMFETMTDMQKKAVETFTSATEQMQKNLFTTNMIDSDFFKKWYESQMAFFNQANGTANNAGNPMEFFNTWMNTQMESAKNWFAGNNNPMFANMNPEMKKSYDSMMSMFNNWTGTMNNTYSEMLKNFSAGNGKEAFSGIFNNAEMYMKTFELWMPMFKSIQDKTFTPETFKSMFNAPLFKDIMDKVFNLQPEFLKNMSEEAKNNMFKMMDANKAAFDNMKSSFTAGMPDASDITNKMFAAYNDAVSQISNAAAPMMKLMTPGADKQNLEMMQEMSTLFSNFSQKNTQLRYMMYVTGTKAMEEVAQNVYNKVRNGDDMSSFANIYQEWLNINDKNFVSLFESEEYSKMMSEVNSMGMKLKRQIDLQMEKAMSNLPIINRSEMDELYKTIHELKKRINMLEKQIDNDAVETASAAEQKPAKKSAKHN